MRPTILAALMMVTLAACSSQPPEEAALEAAAKALGATAVNTLQYSGSGLNHAYFAAIREAIPNKPIKYVISSHHHNDHLGGLRTAVAEGAIIITQEQNKDWFEKVIATPHTVKPDRLAQSPKTATIETVADKRVLTDGVRTMELHGLLNFSHADTMLMAYLPKEKILLETDAYNPPAPNAPPPAVVSPLHMNLYDNLQRLKLDVRQIAPGHGNLVTMNDLLTITGKGQTRRASAN